MALSLSHIPLRGVRTLRFRLAAWNAAIIILTAFVTLFGVRLGVRRALLSELDQVLADDAREVASTIKDAGGAPTSAVIEHLTRMAQSHERRGWYVKLLDADQRTIWASPEAQTDQPGLKTRDRLAPVSLAGYRVLDRRMDEPAGEIRYVRVGGTLQMINQDIARIDRWVFLAACAVLITAPPCAFWLATCAVRPVRQIIQTASRLRPSHLDERLPIRGAGDELDQLADTVNRLLDRIAAYLDTKRDFLANAAHELRTPLAAIRSSVEVALDSSRSEAEYEELLVDVIDECTSLETLVNQLLLLVEAEAGLPAAKFEPVNLKELVVKAVDMFTGVAEARGIELNVGELQPSFVQGNRQHLRQLINNLLDNAVKYTNAGGTVSVRLIAVEQSREARFEVADSGPGISPAEQQHIFQRFYRAESARCRTGGSTGTGLGLSICQSIVQNHGGAIECDSQLNCGSTFTVRLPLATGASQQPRASLGSVPA